MLQQYDAQALTKSQLILVYYLNNVIKYYTFNAKFIEITYYFYFLT